MIRDASEIERERTAGLEEAHGILAAARTALLLTIDRQGNAAIAVFPGGASPHVMLGLVEFAKFKIMFPDPEGN